MTDKQKPYAVVITQPVGHGYKVGDILETFETEEEAYEWIETEGWRGVDVKHIDD